MCHNERLAPTGRYKAMCHYITTILAGTFDLAKVNVIAKPFSLCLEQIENRSVEKFMEPGEVYFHSTSGHCDCGTDLCGLKSKAERAGHASNRLDQQEKKYRKKGWSNTKIERWRSQQEKYYGLRGNESAKSSPGYDCIRYADFFNALFEQTNIQKAGVLLHYYDGSITSKIDIQGRITFRRNQLTPETLFSADEDTLNVFLKR